MEAPESAALTLQYVQLLARRAAAHEQPRPDVPVAVLARLLALGAELSRAHGRVLVHIDAEMWQRLRPEHRRHVLKLPGRYRDVLAVIGERR